MDDDEVALAEASMDLDVDRTELVEECRDRLETVPSLGIVLLVVGRDEVVESRGITGAEGMDELRDELLVWSVVGMSISC